MLKVHISKITTCMLNGSFYINLCNNAAVSEKFPLRLINSRWKLNRNHFSVVFFRETLNWAYQKRSSKWIIAHAIGGCMTSWLLSDHFPCWLISQLSSMLKFTWNHNLAILFNSPLTPCRSSLPWESLKQWWHFWRLDSYYLKRKNAKIKGNLGGGKIHVVRHFNKFKASKYRTANQ